MDLDIVVLNWNTKGELRECLRSLFERPFRHRVRVTVADNASSDGSREMAATEFPQARLVAHPSNLGFGPGNNRAVPSDTGRYVLYLNSDTIVTGCAIDSMLEFAESEPRIGILGPKLLNADGSLQYSCRRFPNLGTGFFRNTPLGRLFPKNRFSQDYLLSDWDHATVRDVDWVSGAALMIRRDLLEVLKGFDEDYFFYCEDVDLCYRAHEAGWRVTYYPEAVIYHIIGRASDKVPTRMTYEFHRSMYLFYKKHYARTTPLVIRPFIVPGLVARSLGQIARYRWRNLKRRFTRS